MEGKRRKKCTQTECRDIDLMKKYEEVLKSYGDKSNKIPKTILYEDVAAFFFISPERVGRIIRKRLKIKHCDSIH
jgi:hypothetical protein